MVKRKKRKKRGHPIAILIGLHNNDAVFWKIFSETIRLHFQINRGRKRKNQNIKQLYHFHEEIINVLRPIIKEGIRSVILLSPPKEEYSDEFLNHVNKHHSWLLKKGDRQVVFSKIIANQAKSQKDVYYLKTQEHLDKLPDPSYYLDHRNKNDFLAFYAYYKMLNHNSCTYKEFY